MATRPKIKDSWQRAEVVFELLVFGVIIGIVEDIVAIRLVTDTPITWTVIGIVVLVTVPFAILGEVVFDNIDFANFLRESIGMLPARDQNNNP